MQGVYPCCIVEISYPARHSTGRGLFSLETDGILWDMVKVILYTTPTCVYCKAAKSFFTENNVAYEEKDVAKDTQARDDMVKKAGVLAVPVIDVDGQVVIGFDKQKLSSLLGIQ